MLIYLSWCHLSYDVITITEPLVLSVNLSLYIYYGYILIMRGWQAESYSPATKTLYRTLRKGTRSLHMGACPG